PLDLLGQRGELGAILEIAREQDDRAGRGMGQALAVVVGESRADDVDHRRTRWQPYFSHSRMTVANATPFSSDSETWVLVMLFLSRRFFSAAVNCSSGLPEGRFTTHTPCQFAGERMPVPSALVKASLAA